EVEFLEEFPITPLDQLRRIFPQDHPLVRRGNRLSVLPVPPQVAETLLLTARKASR
ncbi:MAG: EVE domain-containing protein, partial [Thermaceae bacterium]